MNSRARRFRRAAAAAVVVLLLGACSGGSDEAQTVGTGSVSSSVPADDVTAPAVSHDDFTLITATEEMSPVPTVPPPTIAGQTAAAEDGVIEVAPTLVQAPPPVVDPGSPATTVVPPTTALLGDPAPIPNTTQVPLPPTIAPPPDACTRLAEFEVAGIVEAEGGAVASSTLVDDSTCRITSGSVIVEVYFIPIEQVRNDWYQRTGIEPVGEVSGDAVGFSTFVTPAGGSGSGYTIAIAGGRQGVIVAVKGTADARLVAAEVTVFANQAA